MLLEEENLHINDKIGIFVTTLVVNLYVLNKKMDADACTKDRNRLNQNVLVMRYCGQMYFSLKSALICIILVVYCLPSVNRVVYT